MILKNMYLVGSALLIVFGLVIFVNKYYLKRESNNDQLLEAAAVGDTQLVESLINGANVNARDKNGSTPLHYAVAQGHKDIVYLLLKFKADINAEDNDGISPLHVAAHLYATNEDIDAYNDEKNVIPLLLYTHRIMRLQNIAQNIQPARAEKWSRKKFEERMKQDNIDVKCWGRHGISVVQELERVFNIKFASDVRSFIEEIGNVDFDKVGYHILISGDLNGSYNCVSESRAMGLLEQQLPQGVKIMDMAGVSFIINKDGSIAVYEPVYIKPNRILFTFESFSDLIEALIQEIHQDEAA
jgi:hypothetical protein